MVIWMYIKRNTALKHINMLWFYKSPWKQIQSKPYIQNKKLYTLYTNVAKCELYIYTINNYCDSITITCHFVTRSHSVLFFLPQPIAEAIEAELSRQGRLGEAISSRTSKVKDSLSIWTTMEALAPFVVASAWIYDYYSELYTLNDSMCVDTRDMIYT